MFPYSLLFHSHSFLNSFSFTFFLTFLFLFTSLSPPLLLTVSFLVLSLNECLTLLVSLSPHSHKLSLSLSFSPPLLLISVFLSSLFLSKHLSVSFSLCLAHLCKTRFRILSVEEDRKRRIFALLQILTSHTCPLRSIAHTPQPIQENKVALKKMFLFNLKMCSALKIEMEIPSCFTNPLLSKYFVHKVSKVFV